MEDGQGGEGGGRDLDSMLAQMNSMVSVGSACLSFRLRALQDAKIAEGIKRFLIKCPSPPSNTRDVVSLSPLSP